jgi:hypothetical protein
MAVDARALSELSQEELVLLITGRLGRQPQARPLARGEGECGADPNGPTPASSAP